ncbi:alpha/beta fold hydrolase [Sphingomonas jaspsi]|uniref:alpha/beta fold hydrolase n=1 Tax=Sphingomonas jaspsi TaxID=392409 RepID=UPI0004B90079|nr:alpha/beta hydrolase [Sphingomonas jaspsi]
MAEWTDRYWTSAEGLKLHYRDYAGPLEKPPILCIPGLTRNARDFEGVADRHAGDWRVICVDLRGRGSSDHDPDSSRYSPHHYAADLLKLLDQLGIADAVFVGTSLGGIVTMLMAATDGDRIASALLNDVGPEIDKAGLDRIAAYVGKDVRFADWDEAVNELAARNHDIFPRWGPDDWARFARRVCCEDGGKVRFDYDMRIVDNFNAARAGEPMNAWPLLQGLRGKPVTILRGELSDLLSEATAERMKEEIGAMAELVTVPAVGHAPTLDERESVDALERLLRRVEELEQ